MDTPIDQTHHSLQWLTGIALVGQGGHLLPMMACASKSSLRAITDECGDEDGAEAPDRTRPGLRLIFNDDHGMTPSVTVVNQTAETVELRGVRPSVLSTDNGTYDLGALLANGPRTIEPGHPLVIRITDIGRNVDDPFRGGATGIGDHAVTLPSCPGARTEDADAAPSGSPSWRTPPD